MCKRDRIINQIALMDEIRAKSNINIVTCGSCGDVLLQRLSDEEVKCPYCGFQSDPCDFPDLFYTGMELSEIYNKDEDENFKKKDEIEKMLIDLWGKLGMDIPSNYEDIVQFCFEDVCETADPKNWHSGDVSIAFRRWIEAQSK